MREIVLDTETTGLSPRSGHKVVEIGCVELVNHLPTGRVYHQYVDPERDMPAEAFAVHGLSEDFLSGFPVFDAIADDFLEFISDSQLVIHNAEFDMGFLNAELEMTSRPLLDMDRALDTVRLARRRFPGAQANLDALCRRFAVDNSNRTRHGALLDAELLAEVYLELIGGRQPGFDLAAADGRSETAAARPGVPPSPAQVRASRLAVPEPEELAAHAEFLGKLKDPIWLA